MWGQSTISVSNTLFQHSGRVLVFLGPSVAAQRAKPHDIGSQNNGASSSNSDSNSNSNPKLDPLRHIPTPINAEKKAFEVFRCLKVLVDQGLAYHILCQGDERRLLDAVGVRKHQFSLLHRPSSPYQFSYVFLAAVLVVHVLTRQYHNNLNLNIFRCPNLALIAGISLTWPMCTLRYS